MIRLLFPTVIYFGSLYLSLECWNKGDKTEAISAYAFAGLCFWFWMWTAKKVYNEHKNGELK